MLCCWLASFWLHSANSARWPHSSKYRQTAISRLTLLPDGLSRFQDVRYSARVARMIWQRRVAGRATSDQRDVQAFWAVPLPELFRILGTAPNGLNSQEAHLRLQRAGILAPHHRRTELVILLRQFATPITFILLSATVLSAFLGEAVDAGIIFAIVLLSGLLSFWQEDSASRVMEDLLKTVEVLVEVRRDGNRTHVKAHEVVAGDIVILDTGDLVPGDCRVIEAREVLVDEAPLTGESYPVEKSQAVLPPETAVTARTNCLFMGTHLVRGAAEVVVVEVGGSTEFGKSAERLEQQVPATSFEKGISAFGGLLLRVMLVLVVLIFIINLLLARPLLESFLFSLAIAVGLTPQLLPAIVSISLSLGARVMARAKVIVKRLGAHRRLGCNGHPLHGQNRHAHERLR